MKDKEEQQAREMYEHYLWCCFVTGKHLSGGPGQRSHIIGNTKLNRSIYSDAIIDNPLNWLPVSNLKYNKMVDLGWNEHLKRKVAHLILMQSEEDVEKIRKQIEDIVREKIKEKHGVVCNG